MSNAAPGAGKKSDVSVEATPSHSAAPEKSPANAGGVHATSVATANNHGEPLWASIENLLVRACERECMRNSDCRRPRDERPNTLWFNGLKRVGEGELPSQGACAVVVATTGRVISSHRCQTCRGRHGRPAAPRSPKVTGRATLAIRRAAVAWVIGPALHSPAARAGRCAQAGGSRWVANGVSQGAPGACSSTAAPSGVV